MAVVEEAESTAVAEVLAAGDSMVAGLAVVAFAARAVIAAADSGVVAILSPGLGPAGTATDSDGLAGARHADLVEAEAGLSKAGVVRRLVWADGRGWGLRTRR
jgi:hypothetical protein